VFKNTVIIYCLPNWRNISGYVIATSTIAFFVSSHSVFLVLMVFSTIRLTELVHIHPPMYVTFAFWSICIPLIIHTLMSKLTEIIYVSNMVISKLRNSVQYSTSKHIPYKTLRYLRPHKLYFGVDSVRCFSLKRQSQFAYYGVLIEYCINALVSIPNFNVNSFAAS